MSPRTFSTMPETAVDHPEISQADVARAEKLFASARQRADTGALEFAIALYVQGLTANPEAVDAHQALRGLSLQRKLKGGKPMGMLERRKVAKGKTPAEQMAYFETLLAYDPGEVSYMTGLAKAAREGEYAQAVRWILPILHKVNADDKQDFNTFILVKDIAKQFGMYQQAIDALGYAKQMKPTDSDLDHEYKDLAAQKAMQDGRYGGDFTESLRGRAQQQELIDSEKGIHTAEGMTGVIARAKAAYADEPTEGKLFAYVDALLKANDREREDEALAELEKAHKDTGNFRFKRRAGEIEIRQMNRMEQQLRAAADADPDDAAAKQDVEDYVAFRNEKELGILQEQAQQYPNDHALKYNIGRRLYALGQHDESIPMFQQAQQDPKLRNKARLYLGRAFLMSEFNEEAVGTLRGLVEDYELEDDNAKDFRYWFGRALEANGEYDEAAKVYSKVTQADFNYRDTKDRLKQVRAAAKGD